MENDKMVKITKKALRHLITEYRIEMQKQISDYDYIKEYGSYKPSLSMILHYNKLIYQTKQVLNNLN